MTKRDTTPVWSLFGCFSFVNPLAHISIIQPHTQLITGEQRHDNDDCFLTKGSSLVFHKFLQTVLVDFQSGVASVNSAAVKGTSVDAPCLPVTLPSSFAWGTSLPFSSAWWELFEALELCVYMQNQMSHGLVKVLLCAANIWGTMVCSTMLFILSDMMLLSSHCNTYIIYLDFSWDGQMLGFVAWCVCQDLVCHRVLVILPLQDIVIAHGLQMTMKGVPEHGSRLFYLLW